VLDRNQIVEAIDLAALADELLGPRRGTSRSASWPCPSPQHAQTGRTPPLGVFRAGSGEERWHCHGCGIGGSAIDLVMVAQGLTVAEAIEGLAGRAGVREPFVADSRRPVAAVRPIKAEAVAPAPVADHAGLAAFVDECAERLWQPQGRVVLQWLTQVRGLPEDVLARNRIGADPGRRGQTRPDGMPSSGRAAVLPICEDGRPVFAQLRPVSPLPERPRYLNAASRLATNPRVGIYEPPEAVGRCVIVAEGALDALSANAAGFRAAAVLGALLVGNGAQERAGSLVADRLARLDSPLILAFDADEAGQRGSKALHGLLRERGVRTARLHVPDETNDLNAWMVGSRDWERAFRSAVRTGVTVGQQSRTLAR
jgi:hypothetical protein